MIAFLIVALSVPILAVLCLAPASELWSLLRRPSRRQGQPPSSTEPPRFLFLVPAHDEEASITACVRSLLSLDHPRAASSVVVVADNCSDRTAELARGAGATCLERVDRERPGKPRALAWALDQLPIERWDACVIIDADSVVDPRFARALASRAPLRSKCVQAYFDVSNEEESWLTRLGSLLARVRYEGIYPRKEAVGLNCPLVGNGMCIGTDLLVEEGWSAFSLTENWEIYARYTAAGVPIEYERGARLYSHEASSLAQAETQRKRWLAGRTWVLRHKWRELLRSPAIGAHQKLDAIAELASPGPVLHFALAGGIAALNLGAPTGLPGKALAVLAAATVAPIGLHSLAALSTHPRRWRLLGALLLLPLYAFWRVVTAARTVETFRRGRWVKTIRA